MERKRLSTKFLLFFVVFLLVSIPLPFGLSELTNSLLLKPDAEVPNDVLPLSSKYVWNGAAYVPYIYAYDGAKKCYRVQTHFISGEIYESGVAVFYDPNMTEQRVKSEMWELWLWEGKEPWKIATLNTPISFSITQYEEEIFVNMSRTTSKPNGVLTIAYNFRAGKSLKHWVYWKNTEASAVTVQIRQRWDLANFDKCELQGNIATMTGVYDSPSFLFSNATHGFLVNEDQTSMYERVNERNQTYHILQPTSLDFSGKKAIFTFSNWTLGTNQMLTIDPDTLTLRPNADGTYSTWNEVPNSGHIFSNQFEEGDTSAWTGTSGTPTIDNTVYHHGAYSINSDDDGIEYIYYNLAAGQRTVYLRAYFRITALLDVNGQVAFFLEVRAASGALARIGVTRSAGVNYWQLGYRSAGAFPYDTSATSPSAATWYCVELKVTCSTADGQLDGSYQVFIDGVELADLAQSNVDTDWTTATIIRVGCTATSASGEDLLVDCVVLSTSYIGVESRKDLVDDESDNTALRNTCYAGEDVAYSARKTTYNLEDSADLGTITSVTAYSRAKYNTGGGNEIFRIIWKLGATEAQSANKTLTNAFVDYNDTRTTDPDGGAWSWIDINSTEIGAVPMSLGSGEDVTVSEFWLIVTYTVGAGQEFTYELSVTVTISTALTTWQEKQFATVEIASTTSASLSILLERLYGLTQTTTSTITLIFSKEYLGEFLTTITDTINALATLTFTEQIETPPSSGGGGGGPRQDEWVPLVIPNVPLYVERFVNWLTQMIQEHQKVLVLGFIIILAVAITKKKRKKIETPSWLKT